MIENYIKTSENISYLGEIPSERYEIPPASEIDFEPFTDKEGLDFFPLFEEKDNVFEEIPVFVWDDPSARSFLQQLALVYGYKKNPSLSYTPIRVEQGDSFFVLEWLFQDKRASFYFSENEDNKYSIICYNAAEKTFVNTVKAMPQERYKEIAEEVLSYIS